MGRSIWLWAAYTSASGISLVIPAVADDMRYLPIVLASAANQTVAPEETILVVSVPEEGVAESYLLLDTTFDESDEPAVGRPEFVWADEISAEKVNLKAVANSSLKWARIRDSGLEGLEDKDVVKREIVDRLAAAMPNVRYSIAALPSVVVHLRMGTHYAGSNRVYGAGVSSNSTSVVSFFDVDDYMHPQRIEILNKVFQDTPDLEAVIHSYTRFNMTLWDKYAPLVFADVNETILSYASYEVIWDSLPIEQLPPGQSEPTYEAGTYLWWFPKGMPRWPQGFNDLPHNGWLTLRKETLYEVPYPESLPRGQDSLYNWRLIRARRNFNVISPAIGAYLRVT